MYVWLPIHPRYNRLTTYLRTEVEEGVPNLTTILNTRFGDNTISINFVHPLWSCLEKGVRITVLATTLGLMPVFLWP